MGAGVDWALVPTLPRRVVVTRAPGVFGPWMVEYVLGWCLWVTQRMSTFTTAQRERRWLRDVIPERLGGRTLAVVGLGDIGRAIARARARPRHDGGRGQPVGAPRARREAGLHPGSLRRALALADFVVLTVPLTRETRGMIGQTRSRAMRPAAWLMNIARGPVVDERGLVDALQARRIGGRHPRRLRHRAAARPSSAVALRECRHHAAHLGPQHARGADAGLQSQPRPLSAPASLSTTWSTVGEDTDFRHAHGRFLTSSFKRFTV